MFLQTGKKTVFFTSSPAGLKQESDLGNPRLAFRRVVPCVRWVDGDIGLVTKLVWLTGKGGKSCWGIVKLWLPLPFPPPPSPPYLASQL